LPKAFLSYAKELSFMPSNKSTSTGINASASLSVEQITDRLAEATTRQAVRELVAKQGFDRVNLAWKQLDELTKASLILTKEFDGRIIF